MFRTVHPKTFNIIPDGPGTVYFCGQQVTGKVFLELATDLQAKELRLNLHGKAELMWEEQAGQHGRIRYANREEYVNDTIMLLSQDRPDQTIPKGKHEYTFMFKIPDSCPSSFSGDISGIEYMFRAILVVPRHSDIYARLVITVCSNLDLNKLQPPVSYPVEVEENKVFCCLFCATDPVYGKIRLGRTGFVAGETIPFVAEITNRSSRTMTRAKLKLLMRIVHIGKACCWSKKKTTNKTYLRLEHKEIGPGQTVTWRDEKAVVPALPPSGFEGCTIMEMKYFFALHVIPSGASLRLKTETEVVIGTVPLEGVTEQQALTSQGPSVLTNTNFSSGSAITNQPSMFTTESAFSTKETGEQGNQNTSYYKWT